MIGVTGSELQSQNESQAGVAPTRDYGLMARLGSGLGLELDASRLELSSNSPNAANTDVRSATLAVVLPVGQFFNYHIVPLVFAGAGLDSVTVNGDPNAVYHHIEYGLGLEYRSKKRGGGLVFGADFRTGSRTLDVSASGVKSDIANALGNILLANVPVSPSALPVGDYRQVRCYVGITF